MAVLIAHSTYLLFLSFLSKVALLQTHSSEEISEVAKQGDNTKAKVCEDSHVHGCLFKKLMPVPPGCDTVPWTVLLCKERPR